MQQSLQRKRDLVVRARMALQQAQQARSQLQVNLAGRHSAQAALEQSLTELAATRETLLMRKGEDEDKAAELNEPLVNHAEHVEQARAQVKIAREQMRALREARSEEHTSDIQSLMRISYAVFCLKKKKN